MRILVWHQGALGDLLLAGPVLEAVSRHYPEAVFLGVGQPALWHLLGSSLPVAAVWDSGEALWSCLYQEEGAFPDPLATRLGGIALALVFSPRPRPVFLQRLKEVGVAEVLWLPSFAEDGGEPLPLLQARQLREAGLEISLRPFRLRLKVGLEEDFSPRERLLTLAPGSGNPAKNWPLAHYYEIARNLAWEAKVKVVWLAGPAEEKILPYIQGIAVAQGQILWVNRPLEKVAALLARTWVYVGNDSGLTHLAAAAGAWRVVALFGPTNPRVWAPWGEQVTVLIPPGNPGDKNSLANLPPSLVLAEIKRYL